jgi:hypothetical protein
MRPPVPSAGSVLPSVLCLAADSARYGSVALTVLYDPRTSISTTDFIAFGDI